MQTVQPILIRWPNEDTGDWFKIPGCLVNDHTALAVFDRHVEVHLVAPTDDPNEFELHYASNPLFFVGDDLPTIFHDLLHLSLLQFASKYTHSDFHQEKDGIC